MSPIADPLSAKSLSSAWDASLSTGVDVTILELDTSIFGLSSQGVRMEEWGKSMGIVDANFVTKW